MPNKKYLLLILCLFPLSVFADNTADHGHTPDTADHPSTLQTLIAWGNVSTFSFFSLRRPFLLPAFTRDDSILRYVSSDKPLADTSYRPKNLESLSGTHIDEAGRSSLIRADIKKNLAELADAFYEEFHQPLIAVSGFRSAEYQQRLWDLGKCEWGAFCAIPGRSEHQLGLALDFFDATSETEYLSNSRYKKYVEWMEVNAYKYGFTRSYKNGPVIDNYESEPWHWRYVGLTMAAKLHTLDRSYTEYVKLLENLSTW